jgi:pimeloyl-ACP methyl ester carboxylesterase
MSEVQTSPAPPADGGACPPPLAWHEVVAAVQNDAEPFVFEHDRVRLNGLAIGDGPPLWLLGGFTGDRMQFSLLAWLLKDRCRCVMFDPQWAGSAPRPQEVLAEISAAVAEAATRFSNEPVSLFASSFGALVALEMMSSGSTPVRAAILHAGFAHRQYSVTERLAARAALWSKAAIGHYAVWRSIQETNHRRWFPPIDPARWDYLAANLGDTPAAEVGRRVLAASKCDLRPRLASIRTPVQLIRTEGDGRILSLAEDDLAVALPDVRDESLHSTGHFAHVSHPHRVAKVITSFLETLGGVGAKSHA